MSRVTLATIAKHTGLSKFAVSRSLSGKDGVSDATRKRVHKVAAELGYARPRPRDAIAHDRARLPRHRPGQQRTLHDGAERRSGRSPAPRLPGGDALDPPAGPRSTPSPATASASSCSDRTARKAWRACARSARPLCASAGSIRSSRPTSSSGADHESGSAVGAYLLDLGHRVIAYVHGEPGYRGRKERYYGLREVLEERDDTVLRDLRFEAGKQFRRQARRTARRRASGRRRSSAPMTAWRVTVVSDLLRIGYRIPEDISVVGFGDFAGAMQISPPLTTVRLRGAEMGSACIRQLDDRIHKRGNPDVALRVLVALSLVIRKLAGPVPGLQTAPAKD